MTDRPTVHAVLEHIYTGPMESMLNERLVGLVSGEVRVSQIEWQTSLTDERAFVAILTARLQETIGAMGDSILDLVPTWDWPQR